MKKLFPCIAAGILAAGCSDGKQMNKINFGGQDFNVDSKIVEAKNCVSNGVFSLMKTCQEGEVIKYTPTNGETILFTTEKVKYNGDHPKKGETSEVFDEMLYHSDNEYGKGENFSKITFGNVFGHATNTEDVVYNNLSGKNGKLYGNQTEESFLEKNRTAEGRELLFEEYLGSNGIDYFIQGNVLGIIKDIPNNVQTAINDSSEKIMKHSNLKHIESANAMVIILANNPNDKKYGKYLKYIKDLDIIQDYLKDSRVVSTNTPITFEYFKEVEKTDWFKALKISLGGIGAILVLIIMKEKIKTKREENFKELEI